MKSKAGLLELAEGSYPNNGDESSNKRGRLKRNDQKIRVEIVSEIGGSAIGICTCFSDRYFCCLHMLPVYTGHLP